MQIRCLTYNIHKGIGNDRTYRLDRTIELLRQIDADIVSLQEVDKNVLRSNSEDLAREIAAALGYFYHLALNVRVGQGYYGNATLSRYPLLDQENLDLTWSIKKKRGCLNSLVETPVGTLAVMNFHLGLAGVERYYQVKRILESRFLRQAEEAGYYRLILGDSNDRNHKINPLFQKAGYFDTCRSNRMSSFPAYAPVWRLDKIFHGRKIESLEHSLVQNQLARSTSDHLPVVATLELRERDKGVV